jgi:integrase
MNKIKTKEPVRLRRKKLANGNESLYLDIYSNGIRQYEFLRLYLVPEKNMAAKIQNKESLRLAEMTKAQRILDLNNNNLLISTNQNKINQNFIEYCKNYCDIKNGSAYNGFMFHLEKFTETDLTFKEITKTFCLDFIEYLKTISNQRNKKSLNKNTQLIYFRCLTTILNNAVTDEIIESNPINKLKREQKPKGTTTHVNFLTTEEVKKLEQTEYTKRDVKKAFLFSCYTGLRFSDVKSLKWENIQDINGTKYIIIKTQKTDKQQVLPLNKKALENLPDKKNEYIFDIPRTESSRINKLIKSWKEKAGIEKHITFHVARHTHATLLLSKGATIETVSKMLGHSDIKMTQIYAEVINETVLRASKTLEDL